MARRQGGTLSGFTPLSTPSAPTIDSVTTSIGSASVAFTAPTDVGDAAVSSYVVTAVDESSGASTGATGSASPITVSPGGGTFKIRMQALNAYGPGRLTEYDTGNAIPEGAEIYAWGRAVDGRIGDNTVINRSSPVQVGALATWVMISAGAGAHAINSSGELYGWGLNSGSASGAVGDNTAIDRSSPVQIGALTNWATVSSSGYQAAAVKTDGTLWAWGDAQFGGSVGDNTTISRSSPVQIGLLTNWSKVAADSSRSMLALATGGSLWSWGRNPKGQLGHNNTVYLSSPVQVGALTNWAMVEAGSGFSAALTTDNKLYLWGDNELGQIGDNTIINKSSPVQVAASLSWAAVSVRNHTVAVTTDGRLYAWGNNTQGALGDGTAVRRSSPVQIGALTNWAKVAAGGNNTSAIKTDGTLWTWGYNTFGTLGNNTTVPRSSPIQVGALSDWFDVSNGSLHNTALRV